MSCPSDDDDPVTAEYDVFITPDLAEQIFMLQYPIRNKQQSYNRRRHACPTEMRIKPESGFLESDIAINPQRNYNKKQGINWGTALKQSNGQGVTTFGAAAGFGPGLGKGKPSGPNAASQMVHVDPDNFGAAERNDQVLKKQTLGGQILRAEPGQPIYMFGAFRGGELHLTKIDGIAQMRPQFHHVDAQMHLESQKNRDTNDNRPPPQARAALQSYKGAQDAEDAKVVHERGLWQRAQEEQWTRLDYYDEDDQESYSAYYEKLFVDNLDDQKKLNASMNNESYLEAISAPRVDPGGRQKKKPLTRKQRTAIEQDEDVLEADAL